MKLGLRVLLFIFLMVVPRTFANELVSVSEGTLIPFWMKTQKDKVQTYKIPSLLVQEHQVTNAEFLKFLNKNSKWSKEEISPLFAESNYLDQIHGDANSPITSVSWFAARAYCKDLGLRLPTVVEWEYLASASEKIKDANKDSKFLERILNWYAQPKAEQFPKVKTIYKNMYGLYDMHGLVWEWVEDFNSNLVTGESREDSSLNRNLFCGSGSINAGDKENYASFMRFAFRSSLKGSSNLWNLGFRCVTTAQKKRSQNKEN